MLWFSESQEQGLLANAAFLAMYFVANLADPSRSLKVCWLACLSSIVFSLSPLYNYLLAEHNNSIIFFIYFAVYAIASIHFLISILIDHKNNMANYKPMITCFIMAAFELISYEIFYNDLKYNGTEDILYDYYEVIITLLHVVVISSVVRWDECRRFAGRFCNLLSGFFLDCSMALLNRGQTSYNKKRNDSKR